MDAYEQKTAGGCAYATNKAALSVGRANDLVVNPLKAKQLTNIRAAGTDENLILTKPVRLTLERALEFIDDDELVEVTPKHIRIRKKFLLEHERKRASRSSAA